MQSAHMLYMGNPDYPEGDPYYEGYEGAYGPEGGNPEGNYNPSGTISSTPQPYPTILFSTERYA